MVDSFGCQVAERFPDACYGTADYEYVGKRYCILHLPTENKQLDNFEKAVRSKLEVKNFNFAGVYFPSDFRTFAQVTFGGNASFYEATFGGDASFSEATFGGNASFFNATFGGYASFYGTTFGGDADFFKAAFGGDASFTDATFGGKADFYEATFGGYAYFPEATFGGDAFFYGTTFDGDASFFKAAFGGDAFFSEATFGGKAYFPEATFDKRVTFREATFKERATFYGLQTLPQTTFDFTDATIEKPEQISFHTTNLRPHWFVDVDAQKFDFSDVEWFRSPSGDKLDLEDEIEALKRRNIRQPDSLRKLTKACRRLMNYAEENRDYPTANEFHYWSMEAQRKEGWSRLGLIATLYWAMSGYGERPLRALLVLLWMSALFAALYMVVGPAELRAFPLSGGGQFIVDAGQALVYSFAAIARLRPEPVPDGPGLFQFLVTAAGILGPLQIALFALAVRRRVMR